jgi:N-acetylneuraminate synthase/N,N'-diacetyllegionaminate synthase
MPKSLTIGRRTVGPGEPCFVIAEAGVNHNGDPERAHALVRAAADAGADAIKFQAFRADDLAAEEALAAPYQRRSGATSQLDLLRGLELDASTFASLSDHAVEHGLIFIASAFDEASVEMLDRIGVAAYKIASPDVANPLLLVAVGSRRRPVILSTGTADLAEVQTAVKIVTAAGADGLVVLQCTSAYPAPANQSNLRAMSTMEEALGVPIGFSDHTPGDEIALAAVALGACVLEKHFTLDRSLPGPDHRASLEPNELALLISRVRRVESALGDGIKVPTAAELENAALIRRSLAAAVDLAAGTVLERAMMTALRPGTGIPVARLDELVGRRLRRAIARHEFLDAADLE